MTTRFCLQAQGTCSREQLAIIQASEKWGAFVKTNYEEPKPLPKSSLFVDLTGNRFTKWTVMWYAGKRGQKHIWMCSCDCGVSKAVCGANLVAKTSRSCGCLVEIPEITGLEFHRLTVVSKLDSYPVFRSQYKCVCKCGSECIVRGCSITSGRVKSCGCLVADANRQRSTTHGLSSLDEYRIWQGMIRRCHNKSCKAYRKYGEMGIKVCDRWRNSVELFIADMGKRPSKRHTIDRFPDKSGNYEPGNCRWATMTEQNRNRKDNCIVSAHGKSLCIAEWSSITGINQGTIWNRIRIQGKLPEDAIPASSLQ